MDDYTDCTSLLALYDLTLDELYLMNPSVGPDCAGLEKSTKYCVSWFPNGENPEHWAYQYTGTAIVTANYTNTGSSVSTPSE